MGIHNTKTFLDISAHLIRGSGSEGNHRCLTYLIDYRTNTAIFRSEIMSPL